MPSPPSERSREALLAIKENIERALAIWGRNTEASLAASWEETYLAVRCLEIISEASRRLAPEVLHRHPVLPWRQIQDVGNLLRHGYDAVVPERIWVILDRDLPRLLAMAEEELAV